jgi:RimJ/RimL family protein N-acetyltransferase
MERIKQIETKGIYLLLCDDADEARRLQAAGEPVVGVLTDENRDADFSGISYLVENPEEIDDEDYYRIWQRLKKLPWDILETERCKVRETTVEDVDSFYEIYKAPGITDYTEPLFENPEDEVQYAIDYRENVYSLYGYGIWTVLDKATGKVIGRAGLTMREGFEEPELGYVIAREYQGQGIATEVCKAILEYGHKGLGFTLIQAFTKRENLPSEKLLKKLGFTFDREELLGPEKFDCYILDMR